MYDYFKLDANKLVCRRVVQFSVATLFAIAVYSLLTEENDQSLND